MKPKDYIKKIYRGSQVEVAKKAKVHPSSLNMWLNGWRDITDDALLRVAKVLGVTFEELKSNNVKRGAA